MGGVRNRRGGRLAITVFAGAIAAAMAVSALIGPVAHPVAAQIVCVDSPFLGFFDENEDGVLSLDEVLAVSDANAQVAEVAEEMQERGITGFRYAECEPGAVPTGEDVTAPTQAPQPTSTPTVTPDVQPTATSDLTATSQPADADEDDGPFVVTTLPGVGHGGGASPSPFASAGAGVVALLLETIAVRHQP